MCICGVQAGQPGCKCFTQLQPLSSAINCGVCVCVKRARARARARARGRARESESESEREGERERKKERERDICVCVYTCVCVCVRVCMYTSFYMYGHHRTPGAQPLAQQVRNLQDILRDLASTVPHLPETLKSHRHTTRTYEDL